MLDIGPLFYSSGLLFHNCFRFVMSCTVVGSMILSDLGVLFGTVQYRYRYVLYRLCGSYVKGSQNSHWPCLCGAGGRAGCRRVTQEIVVSTYVRTYAGNDVRCALWTSTTTADRPMMRQNNMIFSYFSNRTEKMK